MWIDTYLQEDPDVFYLFLDRREYRGRLFLLRKHFRFRHATNPSKIRAAFKLNCSALLTSLICIVSPMNKAYFFDSSFLPSLFRRSANPKLTLRTMPAGDAHAHKQSD